MGKLLYTMGEVAQELGENPSAVRYWSNYFEQFVKPQRNAKGNRLYHPEDIETLRQIQYPGRSPAAPERRPPHRGKTCTGAGHAPANP